MRRLVKLSSALAVAALLVGGLTPAATANTEIKGAGASFAKGFMDECIAQYNATNPAIKVAQYGSVGSGSGRSQLLAGTTNFAMSDGYWSGTQVNTARDYIFIPFAGAPLTIPFNVPGVRNLNLTSQNLTDIFSGKVTKWNDASIRANNKNAKLPDNSIIVIYRSDSSGTTQAFTQYLSQHASDWKEVGVFNTAFQPAGSIGAPQNQGVMTAVKNTQYAVGYVDFADASTGGMPLAKVQNGAGQFIAPTLQATQLFLAAQPLPGSKGYVTPRYKVSNIKGAYQLGVYTYYIMPNKPARGVIEFAQYVLNTCGPTRAAAVKYNALSGRMQQYALGKVAKATRP
ncbi:MAG: phosphate ABC transporter substrate-binding protein PstS [Actinobacteria bacterium]|nr:phosphate ABC transporter substrate-binding protein PstS [Actinomycetota bacterium]